LLLAFASTGIPGFSLLEIIDQGFYSLLDMYVFQNEGPLFDEWRGRSFYVAAKFVAP
jgi:hypothetical protein